MIKGFDPVFNDCSEILILGSFPSVLSRKDGFYYGNKRNRFWQTLALIFKEETPTTNEEKRTFILSHKLALWDIVETCNIKGSADSNLKNYSVVNLNKIIDFSKIKVIICNGKKCYEIFIKQYKTLNIKVL
jgi:hypoxanthine-DNA glycosylase